MNGYARRTVLGGGLAIAAAPAIAADSGDIRLIAGTYAREGGAGLYPILYQPRGDTWSVGVPLKGIDDASFGVRSSRHGVDYLLHESPKGQVGAYHRGRLLGTLLPTDGADPCHATLDPAQSVLAIANYSSGNVALYRLDPATGRLIAPAQRVAHKGRGPNAERQEGPHAHWVGFTADSRFLHSVDLGADAIFTNDFDRRARSLGETRVAYKAPAGSGPRHLARHPSLPVAYLVSEMANSLTTLSARRDGSFAMRDICSTLPAGFAGASQAAHIAMNAAGTRLYVSNRGHDSIAVYALDRTGLPGLIQHLATGGRWPRFFLLLEDHRRLVVGNERSGDIAIFVVAPDGRLSAKGHSLNVPGVVFLGLQS